MNICPDTHKEYQPETCKIMALRSETCAACLSKGNQMPKPTQRKMIIDGLLGKEKWCAKCKAYHPADLEHFYKDSRSKTGLSSWCRMSQTKSDPEPAELGPINVEVKDTKPAVENNQGEDSLVLDFSGHQEIFEKLQACAKEEMRPVTMQAMWLLNKQLEETIA